jgi:hypothetical protein
MKDKVIAILIALLALVSFAGLCMLLSYIHCRQFNSPPIVPIYPGSIIIEEVAGGTDVSPIYEYHFTSTAPPDEIVKFYADNKAQCNQTSGIKMGQVCSGDAISFGKYSAGIDFESYEAEKLTSYHISVLWTRCGGIDEFSEP